MANKVGAKKTGAKKPGAKKPGVKKSGAKQGGPRTRTAQAPAASPIATTGATNATSPDITAVVRRVRRHAPKSRLERTQKFVRQYYAHLSVDELENTGADNLAWLAVHHMKTGAKRKPGELLINIYNPAHKQKEGKLGHTVVEVVADDMPFLVDSVTAEINRQGYGVHMAVHPVMRLKRTAQGTVSDVLESAVLGADKDILAESYIQLHIEEQPRTRHRRIEQGLKDVLADVQRAVADWRPMRDELAQLIDELESLAQDIALEDVSEIRDFLRWVHDDHFTLLGYREYRFLGTDEDAKATVVPNSGLGILRNARRVVFQELRDLAKMPPEVRDFVARPDLLFVTKGDVKSRVHRPVPLDVIGIKRLDSDGRVVGERVFVGLFTAGAYNKSARDIPLLRRKIQETFDRANMPLSSHDGKALLNILETFPRDELFQISTDQLLEISLGILRLQDRQRVALFLRCDNFERFFSCLIYVPRDRYTTDLRRKFQAVLEDGLGGTVTAHYAQLGEQALARLHVVVKTTPGEIPDFDAQVLEDRLADLAKSWGDRLGGVLIERYGEMEGVRLLDTYQDAFGRGYEDRFTPDETLRDIEELERTYEFDRLGLNLYELDAPEGPPLRFKIYHPRQPVALSDVLPMLEDLGLRVMEEIPYRVRPKDAPFKIVIHDFGLEPRCDIPGNLDDVRHRFHEAFDRIWEGALESDGLNALILIAGMTWREVTVMRAYTKYLRQTGITFSEDYMARTLNDNPGIARGIVDLLKARFAPATDKDDRTKFQRRATRLNNKLYKLLDDVSSADQDRILRRYINLVNATLRTNYHQTDAHGAPKSWLSVKLSSRDIEELPLPRPKFEIFVYAPEVEGVHLRFGAVARGGLRWSDRREDFRTEVLGLVKAQQVKNAVIVPVGSKGGFVVKRPPPAGAPRDEVLEKGIACYKTFIRGLLDLTDNLDAKGGVAPPPDVVRLDDDDPYLVVAADKGTATFSDIANGVSAEYGFWLGDAFASGGSQGYDHKKMGITARGGWESVKRHFREMGVDTQSKDFTVAGVGDMSGDVFGNGMLLSEHIKLVAAFNHLHIFIDPAPDPASSFKERRRLFDMTRSSWSDYDARKISKGGGVLDRRAKWVNLTPEMKALFGVTQDRLTPNDVIKLILGMDVDLLWFGGIGTYIKARAESDVDAGDRTNDAVRVNASDVRAKVIGEGANLGMTQRARVEYALNGGRLNTDAIDNSAGVDCSDHEVNIKILLDALVREKTLTLRGRNTLLARMTDEVGELVLWDNYEQTQAISVIQTRGTDLVDHQVRLMRLLEKAGRLDRQVEFLPDDEQLTERQVAGHGLTRPEVAVLMSYSKIWLYDELLAGTLPDDPFLARDLTRYFPTPLRKKYADAITRHRLRREIVATRVTNSMINRVGGTFVSQIMEKTGMKAGDIARAFIVTREVFGVRALWHDIEALDNQVSARAQTDMLVEINRLIDRGTIWFLSNTRQPLALEDTVARFKTGVATLARGLKGVLPDHYQDDLAHRAEVYTKAGVPAPLAHAVAGLVNLAAGVDIVTLAERHNMDVTQVAKLYFAVGSRFRLGRLRAACEQMGTGSHWQKLAVASLTEELFGHQRQIAEKVLKASRKGADAQQSIRQWTAAEQDAVDRADQLLTELWSSDIADISQVAVASRALKSLADGGESGA